MKKNYKLNSILLLLLWCGIGLINKTYAQYCTASHANAGNCANTDLITDVSISGTGFSNSVSACAGNARYFDYTASSVVTLHKNPGFNTYTLNVTSNTGSIISVWIDYNQDGSLASTEWKQVTTGGTANQASSVTITIPDTAVIGNTLMRIRSRLTGNQNGSGDACLVMGSGVTHDYLITIDSLVACNGTPTAGSVLSKDTVCINTPFNISAYNGTLGLNQTFQWQESTDNTTWTDRTGDTMSYATVTQSIPKYYRFYTTCSGNTDTSSSKYIFSWLCYCNASATNTNDDDIGNFTMGAYSNGSDTANALSNSSAVNTYSNFTGSTFGTYYLGQSYYASLTQINGSATFYSCYGKAFIDFNQNGTFESSEEVFAGQTTSSTNRYIWDTIAIPMNAIPGFTRLRVVLRENGTATTTTACGTFTYGEVEDYTIEIKGITPKDIAAAAFIDPTNMSPSCSGKNSQSITVKYINSGTDTLDFSLDNLIVNVNAINGANTTNFSAMITSGKLAPSGSQSVNLTNSYNMTAVGDHKFIMYTSMASDTILSNDTLIGPTITILPTITPTSTSPYFETFEKGNGYWVSGGVNNNWDLGTPGKTVINKAAPGGQNSWITGLTSNYVASTQSYVESPCFDLSNLDTLKTEVSLDVWWNSERNYDAAALQYTTDKGVTWKTIGLVGEGNNWYNDTVLTNATVRNYFGITHTWSGRNSTNNGSKGWLSASHSIPGDAFTGIVKFRITFASDPSINDEGFAFDNFRIREIPSKDISNFLLKQPIASPCQNSNQNIIVSLKNTGVDTLDLSVDSITITVNASNTGSGSYSQTFSSGTFYPGTTMDFNITNAFNMSNAGTYDFQVICYMTNDGDRTNDTTVFSSTTITPGYLPLYEDFDNGTPTGYSFNNVTIGTGTGVSASNSLRVSIAAANKTPWAQTPTLGALSNLSALKFTYKFSTTLNTDDSINLLISIDCGQSFMKIYQFNSTNTSSNTFKDYQYDLGQYAGSNILVRIEGYYGSTACIMDLDNLVINDKPDVQLGPDTSSCSNITLDADPNSNSWGILWDNNSTSNVRTFTQTGTYWVKATDVTTGLVNYDTVQVSIYTTPVVNLGNDTSLCPSGNFSISAGNWSAGYKFLWNTGDTTVSITPPSSGQYYCVVTSPGGCYGSDSIQINYTNRPTGVSIIQGSNFNGTFSTGNSSSPDEVCVGNSVTYELTPPSSYNNSNFGTAWAFAGNPTVQTVNGSTPNANSIKLQAPSSSNGSLEFKPTSSEADSTYMISITVIDLSTGCDTTVIRYIKVNGNPTVSLGNDQTICPNTNTTLSPGNYTTYLWSDGTSGATTSASKPGIYWVIISDSKGCKNSDSIEIKNFNAATVSLGTDKELCTGSSLVLDAGTASSYLWNTNETTQTITVNSAKDYIVTITNADGCKASDTVTVSLLPLPKSTFTIQNNGSKTINCNPTDGSLTTYLWDFGDGGQSNLKNPSHVYLSNGKYYIKLKVTDSKGCTSESTDSTNIVSDIAQINHPNYSVSVMPNPFNQESNIIFQSFSNQLVKIELFDVTGALVSTINNGVIGIGEYRYELKTNSNAAGVYQIRITAANSIQTIKVISLGK